jgi:hypothetical protein
MISHPAARLQRIGNQESGYLTPKDDTAGLLELLSLPRTCLSHGCQLRNPRNIRSKELQPLRFHRTVHTSAQRALGTSNPRKPSMPRPREPRRQRAPKGLPTRRLRSFGTSGPEEPSTPRLQKASALPAQEGLQHFELHEPRHQQPTPKTFNSEASTPLAPRRRPSAPSASEPRAPGINPRRLSSESLSVFDFQRTRHLDPSPGDRPTRPAPTASRVPKDL